ncbi:MAG: DUF4157 domain-containing protein [bacterium]
MRNDSGGLPAPSVPLRPGQSGILQRKCACGGAAGMSGECAECSNKKRSGLQTKLKVNEPGDIYEQEADRVADQVLATPAHHAVSGAPPRIQRFAGQPTGQMDAAPASVDQALASPGRPLEPALRQDMEQRFGYDFSRVRVHSGTDAEQSAQDVNAHAYTVGHDIVFGAGRFAPQTHQGRRLLAHELTHFVQQTGHRDAAGLNPVPVRAFNSEPMLARACDALKCPIVELPVGVFVPSWQLAEKCLQDHYKKAFPGHTIGFNKDWVGLTGKDQSEQATIDCFRSHYTAKGYKPKGTGQKPIDPKDVEQYEKGIEREGSQQRQAEPDIFDFTDRTIMEITTPDGVPPRVRKIAQEVKLATDLAQGCHVDAPNQWSTGSWQPEPCYQLVGAGASVAGKLFFRTWRMGGILIYVPVLDITREALAVATATVAVMLWKGLGGGAAARAALGRLAGPVLAVAAIIAFARGAKANPGGDDDVLSAMFKSASDKGVEIPDDLKDLIMKDPRLRKLLVDAGHEGGKLTKAQQQMAEEFTRLVAENADKFTDEELEQLAAITEQVDRELPDAKIKVEDIKKALAALKRGEKPAPGGDVPSKVYTPPTTKPPDKPAPPALSDDLRKRLAADKVASELVEEIIVEQGAGPKVDAAFVEEVLKIVREEKLTEQDVKDIANTTVSTTAKGANAVELLAALKAVIARRKAAKGQIPAPAAGPGGTGGGTPTPQLPGAPDPNFMTETVGAAERVEAEKKAVAKAREVLKNPKRYDYILDNQIEGTFDIPKNIKVGVELSARVVGRANGALFTGAVILVVTGPVDGSPGEWWATTKSAPMYHADGSKAMVLQSMSFKARIAKGARAGAVMGATK